MILTYAGRRAQSLSGDQEPLAKRVRRLLAGLQPSTVVGAAADGGDLIVLEAVLAIPNGPAVHVVLPTTREVFREDSVSPRWQERFDIALREIESRGGTVESLGLEPGEAAYRRANQAMLDRASALAVGGERAAALVIARAGEGEMIKDLVTRAELRDVPTLRIDPTVIIRSRPKCFVAMPYGRKTDVQRKIELDCNQVYGKVLVPALEHAQLYYRRADEEIDSGIVLEPMIEWLAEADLVIADLETANFNVGWELGLRHLMRDGHTLLVGPAGTTVPFDVAALRNVRYRHDEGGVTDDAAIDAWRKMAPYLDRAGQDAPNDSPVATVMDVQRWSVVKRRSRIDARWDTVRQQLALARDLQDTDLMLTVLDTAADLPDDQLRLLRGEAGVGLVRLGRFADAAGLLRDLVASDPHVLRPDAHVYYAQALYRVREPSPEALREAERVLKQVLLARQAHPEVRAGLGAIAKRRLRRHEDDESRRADLQLALDSYRYDFERNLNLYYEGINVVAIGVALAFGYDDDTARSYARELLPAVRVAARLALAKPNEDFWAAATLAECALHERLLGLDDRPDTIREAYRFAGAKRPPAGFIDSTITQLDFLGDIGLPAEPLREARSGLLDGAGRSYSPPRVR